MRFTEGRRFRKERVTSTRARCRLRRLKSIKDACLTNLFTSSAKRWLPILGLGAVVYVAFWTLGYDSAAAPSSLPFSLRGGATVGVAESSYGNEQGGRRGPRGSVDPVELNSPKTTGTSSVAAGKEHGKVWMKVGPTTPASEPSTTTEVTSSTVLAASTPVTSLEVAPTRASRIAASGGDFGHMWIPHDTLYRGYGKVPFPLENVHALPTAYKVVSDCRWGVEYLFFIHTAATHSDHRRVLREVVGNSTYGARYKWTAVFFVGMSSVDKVTRNVAFEAEAKGDVVVLPYMDTYRNLTYKYVYGIKWTLENCPRARYVLKMDDDIVVHLPSLMKRLGGRDEPPLMSQPWITLPKLYCCVWDNMPVIRQTAMPWYIPEKAYPRKFFPRYCSGSAVFMDAAALGPLYKATFSVPYLPVDDAYVTGELAALAGVEYVSLNQFYSFDDRRWQSVVNGSLMVVQVYDAEKRSSAWKSVAEALGREPQERRGVATTANTRITLSVTARSGGAWVRTSWGPATAESMPGTVTKSSRTS
ncbi:hypothetical protein MTO96_021559 [Rhipicephalus appendiculatus]